MTRTRRLSDEVQISPFDRLSFSSEIAEIHQRHQYPDSARFSEDALKRLKVRRICSPLRNHSATRPGRTGDVNDLRRLRKAGRQLAID
jgi:hypothetical protein